MYQYEEKISLLAKLEGAETVMSMLEEFDLEGAVPGICMNDGCEFTAYYEPDCDNGHCELCGTKTVKSAYVLAGVI